MKKYYIYKYTFPNGKVYIGQTSTTAFRYNKMSVYKGQVVYNAMRHYKKWDSEILEYCELDQVDDREIYYIAKYKANARKYGYNRTVGGMGNTNPSKETRALMSQRKKEFYANGGKPNIPVWTDEMRKKMSDWVKDNPNPNRNTSGLIPGNNKKEVDVYIYETNEFVGRYESIREACRQLDLGTAWKHVPQLKTGRRNHVRGYVFKEVESSANE